MTIRIEFLEHDLTGRIVGSPDVPEDVWYRVRNAVLRFEPNAAFSGRSVIVDWSTVASAAADLATIRSRFGARFEYDDGARRQLLRHRTEVKAVAERRGTSERSVSAADVPSLLASRGFVRRRLTPQQLRDVSRLASMMHGANFSVPGAGKTTVLLALDLLTCSEDTALLVVAPKNAFAAWDEVLEDCLTPPFRPFVRLTGSVEDVRAGLSDAPPGARLVMSYDQMRASGRDVAAFMLRTPTHLVLDESHRIKAGVGSQRGQAALALAHLAVRRDILSGTPVPNGLEDLGPQMEFLWPGQRWPDRLANAQTPRDALAPYYVRTTKHELGLGPIRKRYEPVVMSDPQLALYSLVRDELLKVETGIRARLAGVDLDKARQAVLSLLQIASNPVMYVNRVTQNEPLSYPYGNEALRATFAAIYQEADSPKLIRACEIARANAARGERTVIWSTFTHNVERIARLLSDLGATFIHGGVDTGLASDPDTREGRVRRFHSDPDCMVLVANPAACSEGISLHRVCHSAIYVDRSYNAAHFLQSIDRIHRLGLPPEVVTEVHILESVAPQLFGSVDYSVRRRMIAKLQAMVAVLEDLDLQALLLDEATADAPFDYGIQREDVLDLIDQLKGVAPEPGEESF